MQIDTKKNEPRIFESKKIDWEQPRGTQVDARDRGPLPEGPRLGRRVPRADGHRQPAREARLPRARRARRGSIRATIQELPPQPREIKPHPYGIELGILLQDAAGHQEPLARRLPRRGLLAGLARGRGRRSARRAKLSPNARPRNIHGEDAEALYKAIQATKIMAPPTNCISPIGEKAILHGLYKQIKGEFYTAVTRPPAVYRGNPFIIEAGLAFGKGPDQVAADAAEAPAVPLAEGEAARRRRRAGARDPLRQPRAAALPAVGVRHVQGRARDGVEELRRHPVPRRAAGRAHGDLRPHGLGVGAVHERVQGSDRRLRRDPQGDQAGAAGVRPPARCVPAPARAGQERVPAPQHLRAVHRGGRRGLRPSEGRQAAEGQAQGAAPEDRRQADRWR